MDTSTGPSLSPPSAEEGIHTSATGSSASAAASSSGAGATDEAPRCCREVGRTVTELPFGTALPTNMGVECSDADAAKKASSNDVAMKTGDCSSNDMDIEPAKPFRRLSLQQQPESSASSSAQQENEEYSAGDLSSIPDSALNNIVTYLNLPDGLLLQQTCKSLRRDVDPYRHCYICSWNKMILSRSESISANMSSMVRFPSRSESILADLSSPSFYRYLGSKATTPATFNQLLTSLYKFLRRRAVQSEDVLRSLLMNEIWNRHDAPLQKLRGIVADIIAQNKVFSLSLIVETGLATSEDLELAIRLDKIESLYVLRNDPKVQSGHIPCIKCNDGIGAFVCQRGDRCHGTRNDPRQENAVRKYCNDCADRDRYCQVCNEFECEECYLARSFFLMPGILYKRCTVCSRRICSGTDGFERCIMTCKECKLTACRDCREPGWRGDAIPFCPECVRTRVYRRRQMASTWGQQMTSS